MLVYLDITFKVKLDHCCLKIIYKRTSLLWSAYKRWKWWISRDIILNVKLDNFYEKINFQTYQLTVTGVSVPRRDGHAVDEGADRSASRLWNDGRRHRRDVVLHRRVDRVHAKEEQGTSFSVRLSEKFLHWVISGLFFIIFVFLHSWQKTNVLLVNKNCLWLDSNPDPLVFKATS